MMDEAGFTAWARQNQRGLLRTAYLLCGDSGHAEDLVQEALVKVAQRWSRLSDEYPLAYARQIVYRDQVSRWRRRKDAIPTDRLPEVATMAASPETRLVLMQALQRLTQRQRQVLVMRYFDDLTEQECADALGVSKGTVKSVGHDAIAALRAKAPELAHVLQEV